MSIRYLCEPSRNRSCTKALCYTNGGPCGLTDDPSAAVRDLLGNPVRAQTREEEEQHGTEKARAHRR